MNPTNPDFAFHVGQGVAYEGKPWAIVERTLHFSGTRIYTLHRRTPMRLLQTHATELDLRRDGNR